MRQAGDGTFHAIAARHLLLRGGQQDEVVGLRTPGQDAECLRQRHERGAVVVGAEAIEAVALQGGKQRVARPATDSSHGVEVGVQQQGGARGGIAVGQTPYVVRFALRAEAFPGDEICK